MNKVNEIKALIETFSPTGLEIWAQHIWEQLYCYRPMNNDVDHRNDKILSDLWRHAIKLHAERGHGWVGKNCSTMNAGQNAWL